MIKLIASDLDGTLLDDEKQLPGDFFEVLDALEEQGIQFAVASGRTYSAVNHLFPERYHSKIAFICDNGACTYLNGKPANINALDRTTYEEFLNACGRIGGLWAVVCAESGVYHLDCSEEFYNAVGIFYRKHKSIGSLLDIREPVYKVAVCDECGALSHGKPALDEIFGTQLNVQVSGEIWMDVMTAGVNKGSALKKLQNTLGILPSETMAFGDYFNDIEMLENAGISVCPENAHDEIKQVCKRVCSDNNHGGVTAAIKELVLGELKV